MPLYCQNVFSNKQKHWVLSEHGFGLHFWLGYVFLRSRAEFYGSLRTIFFFSTSYRILENLLLNDKIYLPCHILNVFMTFDWQHDCWTCLCVAVAPRSQTLCSFRKQQQIEKFCKNAQTKPKLSWIRKKKRKNAAKAD